jgi:methylmalonyl-CoA/ethylmalonyl-CoA epimerase
MSLAGRDLTQIALFCRDLDRTRNFYRDTLGLPLLFEANGMLFFQLKSQRLMIGLSADAQTGGGVLYFEAPDIDTLGPALEAKGVVFNGPAVTVQRTAAHELKLREFRDPDGNHLALMGIVAL